MSTRIARLRNWWGAKPIRGGWRYREIYRTLRRRHEWRGREMAPAHGRLRSLWLAIAFPHTHTDEELER